MSLPGADNVIIGLILLKHEPHGFDIIRSIAPIPFGIEVAEIELLFLACEDARQPVGNLSRDERFPTAGGLVVEENSVAGEKAVALAVISDHPVGVDFGGAVGAAGVEGRGFILGRGRRPEHLAARGLVKAGFDAAPAEGLEEARRSQRSDVPGVFGEVEAHADVALGAEMVDLIGPEVVDEIGHLLGIGQVAIVEKEPDIRKMRIFIEMVDPAAVEATGTANEAVDFVALMKKKFGKIGTVLAGDSGNERFFHIKILTREYSNKGGIEPLFIYSFEMPSLIVYRIRSACLWILSFCIRFRRWTWTVFR